MMPAPCMKVKFWGVRGSIPSPGQSTSRYGGNTSCVSIELGRDKIMVLDAGTGIRELGKTLVAGSQDIFVLVTHIHWDHIQGFPFFDPIYQKDRLIYVFPYLRGETMFHSLIEQMDGAHFPVTMDDLPSKCRVITENPSIFLSSHGFDVQRVSNNHPGGAYGYRIENSGRSVAYITDNELDPPYKKVSSFNDFVRFCRGADVLIHDAQYTEEDMPLKRGRGHSLVVEACQLAAAAGVKQLVLYHHDPDRTDALLDAIQEEYSAWAKKNGRLTVTAALEGLGIEL